MDGIIGHIPDSVKNDPRVSAIEQKIDKVSSVAENHLTSVRIGESLKKHGLHCRDNGLMQQVILMRLIKAAKDVPGEMLPFVYVYLLAEELNCVYRSLSVLEKHGLEEFLAMVHIFFDKNRVPMAAITDIATTVEEMVKVARDSGLISEGSGSDSPKDQKSSGSTA